MQFIYIHSKMSLALWIWSFSIYMRASTRELVKEIRSALIFSPNWCNRLDVLFIELSPSPYALFPIPFVFILNIFLFSRRNNFYTSKCYHILKIKWLYNFKQENFWLWKYTCDPNKDRNVASTQAWGFVFIFCCLFIYFW